MNVRMGAPPTVLLAHYSPSLFRKR